MRRPTPQNGVERAKDSISADTLAVLSVLDLTELTVGVVVTLNAARTTFRNSHRMANTFWANRNYSQVICVTQLPLLFVLVTHRLTAEGTL